MAKKPTIDGLIDCYDWQHFIFSFPPSEAWLTQNDVPKSRNFENLMIKLQWSPVISAMLNSSALFIVQNWPGMERIELSWSKIAWIIVQESPDYCSI